MSQKSLAQEIITTRYPRPINIKLDEYLDTYGVGLKSIHFLLNDLTKKLEKPIELTGYEIANPLKNHTEFFKDISKELIK